MRAYLALGSNLGDRLLHLRQAAERLAEWGGVRVVACSRIYETAPLGPPQGRYYNAALAVDTTLSPRELLTVCRKVEDRGGRQRTVHWGPRTIDVDILDAGGMAIESETLRLPHPEIANRIFVLVPLLDVASGWRHPVIELTAEEMLRALGEPELADIHPVAEPEEWCPAPARPGEPPERVATGEPT